jgi:hypothetical protein
MRGAINENGGTACTYWVIGGEYETMTFERLCQEGGCLGSVPVLRGCEERVA